MTAAIGAIEYYLPEGVLDNQALVSAFPDWTVDKIERKTGIRLRHIADPGQCASDLAVCAAEKLFDSGVCDRTDIDYILLCTQSPDYFLPTTACLLQDRLGIPQTAGALDFNLGCSGFVYGLGLAKGLIDTGQAENVLLLTAETYSKYLDPADRSLRTLFGDGAAATLVTRSASPESRIGPFLYGTDGSGGDRLMVRAGAMKERAGSDVYLQMNGPDILSFTLRAVPAAVEQLLARAGKRTEDIDLFVFHQANAFLLDCLRQKIRIPSEKFFVHLESCGNTVSSTIPIALKEAQREGRLMPGQLVLLVGFGVGLSWAATLVRF